MFPLADPLQPCWKGWFWVFGGDHDCQGMGGLGIFCIGTWLEYWGNDCMYSWYIPDVHGCQGLLGAIAHSDSASTSPFCEVFIAYKVGQCATKCVSKQNPQSCILSNGQSLSGCLFLHLKQKIDKIDYFSSFFFTCNVSSES